MFQYCCARTVEAKGKVNKVLEISSLSVKTSLQRATVQQYGATQN